MKKITLSVNSYKKALTTLTELETILLQNDNIEYLEYDISGHNTTSVLVLMNLKSALAVYFRFNGDSGFTTTNSKASATDYQEFRLSNGQIDEYAENMLVNRHLGLDIVRQYFINGTRSDLFEWKEAE